MKSGLTPARIEVLKVSNFRALANVEIRKITPLTVLLGPNGSGKSTVFDVFAFLSECFQSGLRNAWDRRGRARELKTRGRRGPVIIEVKYRERRGEPLIVYHLEVEEEDGRPVVEREWLHWKCGAYGAPFRFMEYVRGEGNVVSGEQPDKDDERIEVPLSSPDTLAVSALGQLAENPRVVALRNFIVGWHISGLPSENTRGQPEAGPQERLNRTGDNLANVIRHLSERQSDRLRDICQKLSDQVPRVEKVITEPTAGGRPPLQIKDAPFEDPIIARFASDGTLKMLAWLILFRDPDPPPFIGVEMPEKFLYPRLLYGLAEECRAAAESTQILVTTHSPFFLNALQPGEVRVLWRDDRGHTQCHAVGDDTKVENFMKEGAQLGDLWMEGHLGVGDPLTRSGTPLIHGRAR